MKKTIFALVFLLAALPVLAAPDMTLYAGKSLAQSQLSVSPWGGGSGTDSTDVFLFGGHSLKVTTLDLYQGARMAFSSPVPLAPGDAGRTFQLTLRRGAPTLHYDPRTLPGAATAPAVNPAASQGGTSYGGMMPPGMGYPNGYQGMGQTGYPGVGQTGNSGRGRHRRRNNGVDGTAMTGEIPAPVTIPQVENLRLLFTLADGRQADILRAIPLTADDSVGEEWYSVAVPLSLLKFPGGGTAALQSVTVGGDQFGVFYVGRLRLATDTAPLTASIEGLESAASDQPLTLRAKVDGGLSALKYSWNFDGGSAEQAFGMEATTQFPTAGRDYTVTLTVSDLDGLKRSVQATKKIHILEELPQNTQMQDPRMRGPQMQDPRLQDPRMQDPRQ